MTLRIFLLLSIILSACSTDTDDTVLYMKEPLLAENTFIYESDLYAYALKQRINSLEKDFTILENNTKTGQVSAKAEINKKAIQNAIEENKSKLTTLVNFESIQWKQDQLLIRRAPRKPRGPAPGVIPVDLLKILSNNLKSLTFTLYDRNGNILIESKENTLTPISPSLPFLQYKKIENSPNLKAGTAVKITINRINKDGISDQYSINTIMK